MKWFFHLTVRLLLNLFSPISSVFVHNPHLEEMKDDTLYHFGFGTRTHNLPAMFGDVKVIIFMM